MKKRAFTWLLCAVMLAVMLPAGAAYAAGDVCQIGSVGYATLDLAIAATPSGGSPTQITLLQTIERDSTLTINDNKKIELNLNGFNLNINATSGNGLQVGDGGSLTTTGVGALNATGGSNGNGIYAHTGATVNITGNVTTTDTGFFAGLYANGDGVSNHAG